MRTVLVCEAQVPFVKGGAEFLVRELTTHLRRAGFDAELVSIPFKWYPKGELLAHAAAWRLVDLSESNSRPVDLVIGTKFPTYFVRHPRKVVWLMHQYRAAYELCGSPFGEFDHTELDAGLREHLITLDSRMLRECVARYAISETVGRRLHRYNGLDAPAIYHPSRLAERLHPGPFGDYVLSVGRLEVVKRIDLVIRAMAKVPAPLRLIIVGDGTQREPLERLSEELGLSDRITFRGTVGDTELVELYAGAAAVAFAPYDEDYGLVTLEAFGARKPVVTATDSGGVLEFVEHEQNGLVCAPVEDDLAAAITRLASSPSWAASLGDTGYDKVRGITWDAVIERLTSVLDAT
jgi:glycosyltransferase involved in cell wall biosynthesis